MADLATGTGPQPIPFTTIAKEHAADDTLIVSDLHLGLPDSRPGHLLEMLRERPFGRLVLAGDLFHDPSLRHLDSQSWRLLRYLRELGQERGRELVWLHGNHDRKIARTVAAVLGVDGRESYAWRQHGRCFMALHGDCFDDFVSRHARLGQLCSDVFALCQRCLAPHHGWLNRLDAWQVRMVRLGDRVAEAAARHAAKAAVDVVVCGHTHEPILKRFAAAGRSVAYANTGAWLGKPSSFVTIGRGGLALDYLP